MNGKLSMRIRVRPLILFSFALVLAGCGTAGLATPSAELASTSTASPFASQPQVAGSRCKPALAALASAIETRLTLGAVALRDAYIVESGAALGDFYPIEDGEFEDMYFVGARIEGSGIENVGGVWVTDDPSGGGSIFAVSTRARAFSDWPDRRELEPTADGFEEADSCAHRTPTESPSASQLPDRRMPGMSPYEPGGEYGWTGVSGSSAGMHSVVVVGEGYRQTQIVFAVEDDCFASGEGPEPVPVTVAGLDGWYVEPYDGPGVLFMSAREDGQTTGAYALPIRDLTLCVYLTWDASTTPDELEGARQVVESIRGQAYGRGIRIVFTLPAGWDTG